LRGELSFKKSSLKRNFSGEILLYFIVKKRERFTKDITVRKVFKTTKNLSPFGFFAMKKRDNLIPKNYRKRVTKKLLKRKFTKKYLQNY